MAKTNEIEYKVVKTFGELSRSEYDRTNWKTKEKEHVVETKELRKVSWNGKEPKLEIRSWYNTDGVETCGKGITLTPDEIDALRFLFDSLDEELTATA